MACADRIPARVKILSFGIFVLSLCLVNIVQAAESTCPPIESSFPNGKLEYSYDQRSIVAYFLCDTNSDLQDSSMSVKAFCLESGKWNLTEADFPICLRRLAVPEVDNGLVYKYDEWNMTHRLLKTAEIKHDESVLVQCSSTHEEFRNGVYLDKISDRVSTNKNGTWVPSIAKCEKKSTCPPIHESFPNGVIRYSRIPALKGSYANFLCDANSDLQAQSMPVMAFCLRTGNWNLTGADFPICLRRAAVPEVDNGYLYEYEEQHLTHRLVRTAEIKHDKSVLIQCTYTYEAVRDGVYLEKMIDRVSTNKNGTWIPSIANCRPKPTCPSIHDSFPSRNIKISRLPGLRGSYTDVLCDANSDLRDPTKPVKALCLESGGWNLTEADFPICFRRATVPEVDHGSVYGFNGYSLTRVYVRTEQMKHNESVFIMCNYPYEEFRDGGYLEKWIDRVSTNKNGTWVPSIAKCLSKGCTLPGGYTAYGKKYHNGDIIPVGTRVVADCLHDGYEELKSVLCKAEGTFHKNLKHCTGGCVLPAGYTDYGRKTDSGHIVSVGTIIAADCANDTNGAVQNVTCMEDGTFDKNLQQCTEGCTLPAGYTAYGKKYDSSDLIPVGTKIVADCLNRYETLINAMCKVDGTFDKKLQRCKATDVTDPQSGSDSPWIWYLLIAVVVLGVLSVCIESAMEKAGCDSDSDSQDNARRRVVVANGGRPQTVSYGAPPIMFIDRGQSNASRSVHDRVARNARRGRLQTAASTAPLVIPDYQSQYSASGGRLQTAAYTAPPVPHDYRSQFNASGGSSQIVTYTAPPINVRAPNSSERLKFKDLSEDIDVSTMSDAV